ncbi:alpha/beta fold hydrolase [Streptomyces sp. NPDC018584]|uniref:alpha/beta fold hydrolase n=1 Tax=unclassified Streptomyces TaxID=2593676 RepID=UPI0037B1C71E
MRIDVPGGHLLVKEEGAGDRTVVMLHAGVADHRMWDSVTAILRQGHRVVRYDLRGFGESSPAAQPFRDADDLITVMDAAGVAEAVLVGASYGGKVALEAAALHPERIQGLVLFAPPRPGHGWSEAMEKYAEAEEEALDVGDLDLAVQVNMEMWVRGPERSWGEVLGRHAEAIRESMRVSLVNQKYRDEYKESPEPAFDDNLATIATPAVVAVGTQDVVDFQQIAEHLAGSLPYAELVPFPDTGHLIGLERPDEAAQLINTFLSRIQSA